MINLKKHGILLAVLALAPAIISSPNCKKEGKKAAEKMAEQAIEKASEGTADVDLSGGKVQITTGKGKGEVEYAASSWPEDLPAGVPQFRKWPGRRCDADGKGKHN